MTFCPFTKLSFGMTTLQELKGKMKSHEGYVNVCEGALVMVDAVMEVLEGK